MQPTINLLLVMDRQRTLHAEADNERLATIARAHAREASPSAPERKPLARIRLVRRLVDRLATA